LTEWFALVIQVHS